MAEPLRSPLAPDANAGRVALVTGGGTGIGRATALAFAGTGARVAICGRRPEPLEAARAAAESLGAEVLVQQTDVREPEQVAHLVGAVLERFGRIDVLVNNAGGQFVAPLEAISLKGWRAVHRLNVDAVFDVTREVAERAMIPQRGGLVVTLGISPRRGSPLMAHSAAARAALENLAGSVAINWSRYGIRGVHIAAGVIDTEGLEGYGEDLRTQVRSVIPMGRFGTADEIGQLIAFLATSGGAYVTGTTIVVDGGMDAWGLGIAPPPPEAAP